MKLHIIAFGIARDIFGKSEIDLNLSIQAPTVKEIKQMLTEKYPQFSDLASFNVAVNAEYMGDDTVLKESDEIAIIPPVSGG